MRRFPFGAARIGFLALAIAACAVGCGRYRIAFSDIGELNAIFHQNPDSFWPRNPLRDPPRAALVAQVVQLEMEDPVLGIQSIRRHGARLTPWFLNLEEATLQAYSKMPVVEPVAFREVFNAKHFKDEFFKIKERAAVWSIAGPERPTAFQARANHLWGVYPTTSLDTGGSVGAANVWSFASGDEFYLVVPNEWGEPPWRWFQDPNGYTQRYEQLLTGRVGVPMERQERFVELATALRKELGAAATLYHYTRLYLRANGQYAVDIMDLTAMTHTRDNLPPPWGRRDAPTIRISLTQQIRFADEQRVRSLLNEQFRIMGKLLAKRLGMDLPETETKAAGPAGASEEINPYEDILEREGEQLKARSLEERERLRREEEERRRKALESGETPVKEAPVPAPVPKCSTDPFAPNYDPFCNPEG